MPNSDSDSLTAVVSPTSVGATSLFEAPEAMTQESVEEYTSTPADIATSVRELRRLGFEVTSVSTATVSIAGPKELFQSTFKVRLKKETQEVAPGVKTDYYSISRRPETTVLEAPDELSETIEGVTLAIPPTYFQSPLAPLFAPDPAAYRPIRVPDELAVLLRAARVHRAGATGAGVKVAMPDTGFFAHPWFNEHGFRHQTAILAAGATDAANDPVGHGTGESANIFSAAPDAKLIPIKMGDAVDAFKKARAADADIVTNSWGYPGWDGGGMDWDSLHPYLKALAAEIQLTIDDGIVVCFAAGNGPGASFPTAMEDVISVGGVHVNFPSRDFEASSYASSFTSSIYSGRKVPDVCGFVGRKVVKNGDWFAPSLLLPVQPDAQLDKIWPSTGSNTDGWGLFSGTSAACPQVAGVVALMLEKNPSLTPAQVKTNLKNAARDVTTGTTAGGDTAATGPDDATGAGLVDAKWSWLISMAGVATQFFRATPEEQAALLASGDVPQLSPEFATDLIDTLRSR